MSKGVKNVALENYPPQGSKAKGTRSTFYHSQKEVLSLTYYTTTIQVLIKSSCKEKKDKVESII
jgi:hypothetical protein